MASNEQLLREMAQRELCRRRLLPFVLRLMPAYQPGWVHHEICERLEQFVDDVVHLRSPRLMIFMPPRVGKSLLASEMLPSWALGRYPWLEVISTSYGSTLTEGFSRTIRRFVREDPQYHALFPGVVLDEETQAVNRWLLRYNDPHSGALRLGGGYRAVGVGGALTGAGANILVVDDPVKNAEEANSETLRDATWNWYATTARTRLLPGGGVLVVQCMTGDTPVLRPDGAETPLRDLRPGDLVCSYKDGALVNRRVLNWQLSGTDNVFAIRTTCGKVVRANERHPFLVRTTTGETAWVRTKDLKPGDSLVRLRDAHAPGRQRQSRACVAPASRERAGIVGTHPPGTCRPGTTESTAARGVRSLIVNSQRYVRGFARLTITSTAGRLATALRRLIKRLGARLTSSTGTASRWSSTTDSSLSSAVAVPCAGSPRTSGTHERTGVANSASTTAILPIVSGRSCVTTVTSRWVTPKHLRSPGPWPATSSFTPALIESITVDGVEDVFDIEVDDTENFIADSLVSSNTRWHDDDLSGRIIELMKQDPAADQFEVIVYPALAEFDEPHRHAGEALHPARYDERAYAQIRASVGPTVWNALYQQNPVPDEGEFFKKDDLQYYTTMPPLTSMRIYGSWDLAISQRDGADPSVGLIVGFDAERNIYVLDRYYGRMGAQEIVSRMVESQQKWKPDLHWMEKEKVQMALGPFIELAMNEAKIHDFVIEPLPPGRRDKESRARPLQGMIQRRKVFFPRTAEWTPSMVAELLRFPKGRHDDQVDALAYAALNVNEVTIPNKEARDEPKKSWRDSLWKRVSGDKSSGHMAS